MRPSRTCPTHEILHAVIQCLAVTHWAVARSSGYGPAYCSSASLWPFGLSPSGSDDGRGGKRRTADMVTAHAMASLRAAAPRSVITYRSALALTTRRLT